MIYILISQIILDFVFMLCLFFQHKINIHVRNILEELIDY